MMMKLVISLILLINIATLKSDYVIKPCGPFEEYRCDYQCQKSCETLDILVKCVSEKICRCFCIEGYVRDNRNGQCIPIRDCPTCPANQTYKASGIACQTCKNHLYVRCAVIEERRCYCLDGYVFDEESGFCKLPQDCPCSCH